MPNKTISLRLPEDLLRKLPTSNTRRSPSRTEFIVAALKEKLARDAEKYALPIPGQSGES
jgi:metal-responsive CopG/Arc/MetJ family transcriptional regulator